MIRRIIVIQIFRWILMIIISMIAFIACLLAFIGNTIWEWLILIVEFTIKPFVMIYIWAIGFWSFITNFYKNFNANLEQK